MPFGAVPRSAKNKRKPLHVVVYTQGHTRDCGLGERIRTSGLLNPIQARYQTAPHPDNQRTSLYRSMVWIASMNFRGFQSINCSGSRAILRNRFRRQPPAASRTYASALAAPRPPAPAAARQAWRRRGGRHALGRYAPMALSVLCSVAAGSARGSMPCLAHSAAAVPAAWPVM